MEKNWIKVADQLPPRQTVVGTKIEEDGEVRNEQPLKLHAHGNLWWHPDSSMYVYYQPTHWKLQTP